MVFVVSRKDVCNETPHGLRASRLRCLTKTFLAALLVMCALNLLTSERKRKNWTWKRLGRTCGVEPWMLHVFGRGRSKESW